MTGQFTYLKMLQKIKFCLLAIFASISHLYGQEYYFRHYKVENGLSHNTVHSTLQDSQGFLWFGTKDGLNRFDGYNFKVFQNDLESPNSLGSNFIECLHEFNGHLWVGTDNGLFRFNAEYESFKLMEPSLNRPILDIEHDNEGNLWYIAGTTLYKHSTKSQNTHVFETEAYFHAEEITRGTDGTIWVANDRFLHHYDRDNGAFETIELISEKSSNLPFIVSKLFAINDTTLLIGTQNQGVILYDTQKKQVKKLLPASEDPLYIRDFAKIENGKLWIATESGIYIYDMEKETYLNLKKSYYDPYALSDNAIYSLTVDREGGVWIGTFFGGVNYYPKQYTPFKRYYPKSGKNSISGSAVREIHSDQYGNIWIGTEDAGLNKFDPKSGMFTNFSPSGTQHSLSFYNIHGLLPRGNQLWIGTFEHGLDIMDIHSGKVIKHYNKGDGHGLSSNFIYTFYENRAKDIYAITSSGIQIYDEENDRFITIDAFPEGIFFTSFLEDNTGRMWAGTYWDGLFYYDPETNEKGVYKHDTSNLNSISSNAINWIFQDSDENIWVTTENGLNMFIPETNSFKPYRKRDGFPSNVFYSIIEDTNNHLWISTSNGLVDFNPKNDELTNYTKGNGLLSDQFNYNSAFKDRQGKMYFGSVNGMISFDPNSFLKDSYKPPILITGLQINNKEVPVNSNSSTLRKSITFVDKIKLQPRQSSFSIDFAALSYTTPEMTEYWYKLDGLKNEWVHLAKSHQVYFTELPAGNYNFKVKSLNSSGVWSDEATALGITVYPTFWKSNLAYSLYILTVCIISFLIIRYYYLRSLARNKQVLKELNDKKQKELYKAKIEFFTNVSHEVRTPLTLIQAPLEKLLKQAESGSELRENLSIMEKNTTRLLNLVNQLLDFRKTELEDISLTFVETNISDLIRQTQTRFSQVIKSAGIDFDMLLQEEDIYAYVDAEALNKIVSNLFNNAIKYAEKKVRVILAPAGDYFQLTFMNDGQLIPVHLKTKIFEPFYRVPGVENQNQSGTGIGLSLAHSLTQLHNGVLQLDTSNDTMNTFVLKLPIHQEKEFELSSSKEWKPESQKDQPEEDFEMAGYKPTILFVEDNIDLLDFVSKDLMTSYLVLKATNAQEALETMENENIQLVISDVMLPGMDGFAFCEKIKTDLETSHIPVIILTAKSALKARLEGLESGADAYIEKPFIIEHLKLQIANLLENRRHIMEHYASSPLAHIRSIAHTKTDETFIKKLDDIIDQHISDPELNVETLADFMHMSRSTLYRKIKEMSNLSPNELVNLARLKKAAELLDTGSYKIYEIAEMVGYNSQTSFGRNFQKQFNKTPTEYIKTIST